MVRSRRYRESEMRMRDLAKLMSELGRRTPLQRRQVAAELVMGLRKLAAIEIIEERLGATPLCPHCAREKMVRNDTADGLQRFKCRSCATGCR